MTISPGACCKILPRLADGTTRVPLFCHCGGDLLDRRDHHRDFTFKERQSYYAIAGRVACDSTVIVLEVLGREARVLTLEGAVGWIDVDFLVAP